MQEPPPSHAHEGVHPPGSRRLVVLAGLALVSGVLVTAAGSVHDLLAARRGVAARAVHLAAAEAHLAEGRLELASAALAEARRPFFGPADRRADVRLHLERVVRGLDPPAPDAAVRADYLAGLGLAEPALGVAPALAHAALCRVRQVRGEAEEADEACRLAVEAWPRDPDALFLLGMARNRRRDQAGARAAFVEALRWAPAHFGARLESVALELGRPNPDLDAAVQRLRALLEVHAAPRVHFYLGVVHNRRKDYEAAVVELELARSALQEQVPELLTHLGYAFVQTGELGSARPVLREAYRRTRDVAALYSLGLTYASEAELPERIRTLRRVVARAPELPDARFGLAQACDRAGLSEEARGGYADFIELAGRDRAAAAKVAEARRRLEVLGGGRGAGP